MTTAPSPATDRSLSESVWATATSVTDLQALMLRFLRGELYGTPTSDGPLDDESGSIREMLVRITGLGFITTMSQPGLYDPEGLQQRAFIIGIGDPVANGRLQTMARAESHFVSHPHGQGAIVASREVRGDTIEGSADEDWNGLDDEDTEDFSENDVFPTRLGQGHGFIELYLEDAGVELDAAGFWLVPRWMVDDVDAWIDENLRARVRRDTRRQERPSAP